MGAHRFPFRASSLNDLCCCVLVGIHDLLPSIDESTSILFYTRPYPVNRGTREREHCTYVVNLINFRECRVLEVPGVEWLPKRRRLKLCVMECQSFKTKYYLEYIIRKRPHWRAPGFGFASGG